MLKYCTNYKFITPTTRILIKLLFPSVTMDLYNNLGKLGKGHYGTVYCCQRKHNLQKLVMKVINEDIISEHETTGAKNEVAILKALKHPNIIQYYDSFLKQEKFYIVMEYAAKGTLHAAILKRTPNQYFPQDDVLIIFTQIVMALDYIHRKKIIHRDLKSENIFLAGSKGRTVKIGDFGISKLLTGGLKVTKTTIGTTNYIAPEICDGKAYDNKSDIWSLGCVLYEICELERLFNGTLTNIILSIKGGYNKQINQNRYNPFLQDVIENMVLLNPRSRLTTKEILCSSLISQAYLNILLNEGNII